MVAHEERVCYPIPVMVNEPLEDALSPFLSFFFGAQQEFVQVSFPNRTSTGWQPFAVFGEKKETPVPEELIALPEGPPIGFHDSIDDHLPVTDEYSTYLTILIENWKIERSLVHTE